MADKKNIVIRVNYPKHGNRLEKPLSTPELTTEWHVKRISLAVAALVLLCAAAFLVINHDSHDSQTSGVNKPDVLPESAKVIKETGNSASSEKQLTINTAPESKTPITPAMAKKVPVPAQAIIAQVPEKQAAVKTNMTPTTADDEKTSLGTEAAEEKSPAGKNKEPVKNSPSSIDNKGVSRALLTTGINNREPIDNFMPPVKIGNKQTLLLYYFTELRKSKERALYHEWLRNGKVVAKRQLYIGADRWRTSSNMTFSDRNKGNWTVRLVDKTGMILNKISFTVVSGE